MRSTFHGLELAKRALYAQQTAINTTGHNVSNANTPGYTRQRVEMVTTPPLEAIGMNRSPAKGQLGTGVMVNAIVRLRDRFLDLQYRNENRYLSEWNVKQNTYDKLEVIFNEIKASDDGFGTGLNRVFNDFWNAWQDLSRDPEKLEAKVAVVHRGVALAEAFNTMGRQLDTFEADLLKQTGQKVDQANVLLSQIAELNQQIVKILAMGQNPNDLMDRRDLLVDELSGLINIEVKEDELGGYQILLSGTSHELVSANGKQIDELVFANNELRLSSFDSADPALYTINGTSNADISGEIFGYLQSIEKVRWYSAQLDTLTLEFVNAINMVYNPPSNPSNTQDPDQNLFVFDDGNYTDSSNAAVRIKLNSTLVQNPASLKAGNDTSLPGDGDLARAIAQLRNQPIIGGTTVSEFYNGIVGQLGIESQEAQRRVENHQLLVYQTDMLRQSVGGVSLNEEMSNLVMFQHAYNAAARALTVMDEMLDKLINGTGIVGR